MPCPSGRYIINLYYVGFPGVLGVLSETGGQGLNCEGAKVAKRVIFIDSERKTRINKDLSLTGSKNTVVNDHLKARVMDSLCAALLDENA